MPRVTVIIPTYNWSEVLPYSIGSVLNQSYRDFELLVIGDACTDDSADVVARVGDARTRWINRAENWGQAAGPYNDGLREARGEIIAHLAHDDLWLPHHLEVMVKGLEREASVAYGLAAYIDRDGAAPRPGPRRAHEYHPGKAIPPANVVVWRELALRIGGWRHYRELDTWPDTDMWNRLHAADPRFRFVPRLTVVRFPADKRKDVYKQRPSHEQKQWFERIRTEPDLEPRLLAEMAVNLQPPARPPTWREKLAARLRGRKTGDLHFFEERRAFKGLAPKPGA